MAHLVDLLFRNGSVIGCDSSSVDTASESEAPPLQPSIKSVYAKNLLLRKTGRRYVKAVGQDGLQEPPKEAPKIPYLESFAPEIASLMRENWQYEQLLPEFTLRDSEYKPPANAEPVRHKVVIVGAGAAGLMTAMCFEYLNKHADKTGLFFDYEVLEAQNRIGGRIYTHEFTNPDTKGLPHQYYDIGAMRIPDIPGMAPTLNLIKYFNDLATERGMQEPVPLAPYYMGNTDKRNPPPNFFTHQNIDGDDIDADIGEFASFFTEIMNKFTDFETGFKNLVDNYDAMSTRQYLWDAMVAKLSSKPTSDDLRKAFEKITKWETYFGGTGWFNQAFSETVLEWYDFKFKPSTGISHTGWLRVDGGMQRLTDAMSNENVGGIPREKIHLNSPVTGIAYDESKSKLVVTIDNKTTKEYDGLFSSATLGCLQRMNTPCLPSTTTELGNTQFNAIRCLQYDVSCKIAIQFSKAWWKLDARVTAPGCVSGSDMPIRSVVYPSWINESNENGPIVVIVSYNWGQDAVRMGSLINDTGNDCYPETDKGVDAARLTLVLQNLAAMYNKICPKITEDYLRSLVMSHHAYAWSSNPYTADAFAFFGPGQFKYVYPALKAPIEGTHGRMMVVGEAVSAHHAWISGALYSAVTGVDTWLAAMDSEAGTEAGKLLRESPLFKGDIENMDEEAAVETLKSIVGLDDRLSHAVGQLAMCEPTDERFKRREC